MSKSKRRVQAPKRREPDLTALRAQFTVQRGCPTGQTGYPLSVAKAKGGEIVPCSICDWYHVRKDES